ncbi:transposase [Alistipes sp. An116]|uniref:site-specific integrase n=1 Tax=Alistipes sp. An116 TaxID=1965546 RepID=UPI000B37EA26|nr:site-specific integrase [Alistipes sp. An116]OUQ51294.1 transposase [Alistipes sp. An116]
MRNTFKVLFFVKRAALKKSGKAPIIARITIDQDKIQFYTKLEVAPDLWDVPRGKVTGRGPEALQINALLDDIRMAIQKQYHSLLETDGYVTAERVRDAYLGKTEKTRTILEFFEQHNEQYLQEVKMDPTNKTYWRYELTRRRLEEFIKYKYSVSDMPLKDINVLFVENFLLFNENVHGCNHNTAMKFVQRLRTVVNFAKNTGMLFVDPFGNFKVKFERTDRGYLTMEEIMAIYHHTFPSRRLEQVRDLFIFSCFTALSYIDVCELQPDDISTGFDGNLWIIRKRHKTNVTASIRLLDIPIAILKKYKGKLPDGKLLPVISNQRVNDYLKEIAAMCGINKRLTFHMARHSCATSVLLANDVPIETVSKILGHTNIRTTQIYARITDRKVSKDMDLLAQKLNHVGIRKHRTTSVI